MTDNDERTLHPATAAELAESLSFALRYAGRKRVHTADDVMARVTAERLVQHLERSGLARTFCVPPRLQHGEHDAGARLAGARDQVAAGDRDHVA